MCCFVSLLMLLLCCWCCWCSWCWLMLNRRNVRRHIVGVVQLGDEMQKFRPARLFGGMSWDIPDTTLLFFDLMSVYYLFVLGFIFRPPCWTFVIHAKIDSKSGWIHVARVFSETLANLLSKMLKTHMSKHAIHRPHISAHIQYVLVSLWLTMEGEYAPPTQWAPVSLLSWSTLSEQLWHCGDFLN